MVQVMNILSSFVQVKNDDKTLNKKVSDFKDIIKNIKNSASKRDGKSIDGSTPLDDKQISDMIAMILNLINNSFHLNLSASQDNLESLKESILNQLDNIIASQNGTKINLSKLVEIIIKTLNDKYNLKIDANDVLNALKNVDLTKLKSDVIMLDANSITKDDVMNESNQSSSDVDVQKQLTTINDNGNARSSTNAYDSKMVVDTKVEVKNGNLSQNESQSQNDNLNGTQKDANFEISNKILSKKSDNTSQQINDGTLVETKSDNLIAFNAVQSKQVAALEGNIDSKNNVQINDIIDQIVKNVNITKTDTESNIKIQLKPDFLGNLEINIKSVDGSLTANILTDNEKVKHQIEANLNILNNQLESKGIKIDSFNVSIDRNMQFASQYSGQEDSSQRYKSPNNSKVHINYEDYDDADFQTQTYSRLNSISNDHVDVVV
ncbi:MULTISPECIES: flagellar hook-length control protein FliK [Thermoanaerobacterium]|uniref:Flagellar hook-length control protein-like protein n=1 Tax=Thermoanaerobacterium xylanolyticum (strain ATCC 49914 / DSM 7097 / LX-11) TaxID=858215 RepID=F6BFM0_THEXL|nr:flagellar hook-length control protein FliK [Thermoanaerobacterium xylanolyticum]AEF17359.1 Flagellar hook-length control protein-like protein [Thermoanaerobacterium xylanolyticum LX-11]